MTRALEAEWGPAQDRSFLDDHVGAGHAWDRHLNERVLAGRNRLHHFPFPVVKKKVDDTHFFGEVHHELHIRDFDLEVGSGSSNS
ncbi:MAG TPA: hypothetical protein VD998_04280 [Verrucomicrobiae bacterium]|nr:hypothetical protein [Verrucomicrobiae bacterium]